MILPLCTQARPLSVFSTLGMRSFHDAGASDTKRSPGRYQKSKWQSAEIISLMIRPPSFALTEHSSTRKCTKATKDFVFYDLKLRALRVFVLRSTLPTSKKSPGIL